MSDRPHDPWQHGAHRVVISRKVSDEETISIEFYDDRQEHAQKQMECYLEALRAHMVQYNKRVVMLFTKQLRTIEHAIETKGEQLREIERKLGEYDDASNGKLPPGVSQEQVLE